MVFKRRDKLGWTASLREMVYPTGGFRRATRYVMLRMRRLPDTPERIARGIFAGLLIGFLPLPGLQFVVAAALAWAMRGNIFAALLGTFNSNPVTTPIFAVISINIGHWMLGGEARPTATAIGAAFVDSGIDIYDNLWALLGWGHMRWDGLYQFWHTVYLPYFIGALLPGFVLSVVGYYITIPIVRAYQKLRTAKASERRSARRRFYAESVARSKQAPPPDAPPSAE